jgi:hypothetical protein
VRPPGKLVTAGRAACVAFLSAAALAACGPSGPAAQAPSAVASTATSAAVPTALATARPSARVSPQPSAAPAQRPAVSVAFTVSGDRPVLPNDSQSTYAATHGVVCDRAQFTRDASVGQQVAAGFALAGFSASAALLQHFLQGKGTAVSYGAGTSIARQALASSAFQAVNREVQSLIAGQLRVGPRHVELAAAQLPLVAFESAGSDLYWGFRGTQGLVVTGSGLRVRGRYTGILKYVIRDSYGFSAADTLAGFGPPLRYLQTVCGAPRHAGGAHWFPDSITVLVPFSEPA